jgi:hypothetical protein
VPKDFMVDWAKHLKGDAEPQPEGMTPQEILQAFDRLIDQQEKAGAVRRQAQ